MCILAGFPSTPNSLLTTTAAPFGLWFADANTLYVADEGDGYTGGTDLYTHAAAQTTAGLQKWVFNSSTKLWSLAYTLQNGLKLGTAYKIQGYPTGTNAATALPWAPAADGLRNITGSVDGFGLVSIWGITSTVSGNGDTGADPNQLVVITDLVKNTDPKVASFERLPKELCHSEPGPSPVRKLLSLRPPRSAAIETCPTRSNPPPSPT